jgi:hypothetical protein
MGCQEGGASEEDGSGGKARVVTGPGLRSAEVLRRRPYPARPQPAPGTSRAVQISHQIGGLCQRPCTSCLSGSDLDGCVNLLPPASEFYAQVPMPLLSPGMAV